jgi:hypothetical protein
MWDMCGPCSSAATKEQRHIVSVSVTVAELSWSVAFDIPRHKRTHTGDRPYVCPFEGCGRAFGQLATLHDHKKIHTGEFRFVCDVEGKKRHGVERECAFKLLAASE